MDRRPVRIAAAGGAAAGGEKKEKKVGVKITRRDVVVGIGGLAVGLVGGLALSTLIEKGAAAPAPPGTWSQIQQIATARKLSADDVVNAVKTYVPGGMGDEFYLFSSGGHSGQVGVMGLPSMKLYRIIAVFTPEPWQGWGYHDKKTMETLFSERATAGRPLSWGDTHHPEFDRQNAEYVGRWLFIGDKANGRAAAISLLDFETKDIVKIPNVQTIHGGAFATPNTEYVVYATQYPAPWEPGRGYKPGVTKVPWSQIVKDENYFWQYMRGAITFLAFDRDTGRFDLTKSFQIEVPPYVQDLTTVSWGPGDGLAFVNSFGTEGMFGETPYEAKLSKNDYDLLHVVLWRKAEDLCLRQGRCKEMNGIKVLSLDDAIKEGVLFFVREPKSPHGVDTSPGGNFISVGGKLAPYATIYSTQKIKQAIADKKFEGQDRYGVPILDYNSVVVSQVEACLGPLQTEFDGRGNAYISCFVENVVTKFTLGPPEYQGDKPFTVVDKVQIHYNVGHICIPESNSPNPAGKYLVAMNKWSLDRFFKVGPLLPQNFQLIDISGDKMKLLADVPIGWGEPHYAKAIRAEKLQPPQVYPVGANPHVMKGGQFQVDPNAVTEVGKERVQRYQLPDGRWVTEVWGTVIRSTIRPNIIVAKKGDIVRLHLTNIEKSIDATHGFALSEYNVAASLEPGEYAEIEFVADIPGVFAFYCYEFCSPLHLEMAGWLVVEE